MGVQIEFTGFSSDCQVRGTLQLDDARLSDLLNRSQTIMLRDVRLVSHRDGSVTELTELEVARDDLTAVVAVGPRGDPARRLRTRPQEIDVLLDGYSARGFVHAPPAGDPLGAFERRSAMVPLTEASLAYRFCEGPVTDVFATLLVNRDHARSVRATDIPARP